MKKESFILLILWLSIVGMQRVSAQAPSAATKPGLSVYILIGQSNMAGRGTLTEAYKNDTSQQVLMLNKAKQWVTARHPLHFDKPVAGVGPGLQFGFYMAAFNPAVKIGLVPVAVGGTSIAAWQPGAFDSATKTHPYDDAIERIKAAMKDGTIDGVIWLQGESDVNRYDAESYIALFIKLVTNIRMVANNSTLPFVVGELGQYKVAYQKFNQHVLKQIPAKITHCMVVQSDDLVDGGDNIHFDAASAELYGRRFGEAMVKLKNK